MLLEMNKKNLMNWYCIGIRVIHFDGSVLYDLHVHIKYVLQDINRCKHLNLNPKIVLLCRESFMGCQKGVYVTS